MFFTIGSVIFIGLISEFFNKSILFRIFGVLTGAVIFFLITNFGVWVGGMYGNTLEGLFTAYLLGLPFFGNTLVSTLIFSTIIETLVKFLKSKLNIYY